MLGQDQRQLEMFDKYVSGNAEYNEVNGDKARILHNQFKRHKLSLFIIIFIVANLLSFSFGVENGLRLAKAKKDIKDTAVINNLPVITNLPVNEKSIEDKTIEEKPKVKPPDNFPDKKYSVQVASYRKMPNAEKEANSLKKKGYTSFVLKKGDYVIVCVGRFQDKTEASAYLNKLKKMYADPFVRRI